MAAEPIADIDGLCRRVVDYQPEADCDLIRKAYDYAQLAHREQTRKSGDPYFVHPSGVAGIIADLRLDTSSICAGLLHDVVEDAGIELEDIESDFGSEVAFLVDGVTKLGQINFASRQFTSREDRQAENFRKMVVAMAQDIRVLLIKLCDRLDNMRTLQFMKHESQQRIAHETMEIYAPLAGRLGIQRIKAELEDLAFRYTDPVNYRKIITQLRKTKKERERYVESVCKVITSHLAEAGLEADVIGRAKHVHSIYRKMTEAQCDFEQLYDIIAFRVRVETVAACYAALGALHGRWTPVPGRIKDYIALPKPNMYQSLHTTLVGPGRQRIEVQVRTHEMDRTAEHGIAAHWQYKERNSGGVDPQDAQRFFWLRELAEQQDITDPAEFIESVKIDLFPDEVYVFTPKGDLLVLPRRASPVDFAYAIHSEVGHHCSGARVNGHIVPLRHKLQNGDVVEIRTSPNQRPNKDWLDFCSTTRARNRIRAFLRSEHRQKSINLGRELLETEMRSAGMSLTKLFKNEAELRRVVETLHYSSRDEMLLGIGYGKLQPERVIEAIKARQSDDEQEPPREFRPSAIEQLVRRFTGKDQEGILVAGEDNVLVRYAKCCNPLPGDPIVGFITRGRGATIHRRNCAKAFNNIDPARRIDVSWDPKAKVTRPVQLRVMTSNMPGILATVSQTFSAHKVNINEATCRANDDGRASNTFTVQISDLNQLRALMTDLAQLKGVVQVERV